MRTIIAGSRDGINYDDLLSAVEQIDWNPTVVLSGTARGADRMGERWASENNIPVEKFPADWNRYGKSAGYRRNAEMAQNADALIALWNGKSRGTKHMIDLANKAGLKIYIFGVGDD